MDIKKCFQEKLKKTKLLFGACYVLIFLPMLYAIYYSVPASDDFVFGIQAFSKNPFAEAAGFSWHHWCEMSGRWLTFIIQKLMCPLNNHKHLGHTYGIYMCILFIVFSVAIIWSVHVLVQYVLENTNLQETKIGFLVSLTTLLITIVLYSTYYYAETYNWYVGATAYAMPMACALVTFALIIYYSKKPTKGLYIAIILVPILALTNEFMDAPIGLFYLYIIFFKPGIKSYKGKELLVKLIPFIVYVLCGLSMVLAPGNFKRRDVYGVSISPVRIILQTIIDIVVRIKDIVFDHPLAVICFIVIFIIGIVSYKGEQKVTNPLRVVLFMGIGIFGAILPYVYGRGFTNTYMDNRMQYILDFFLEISLCLACLLIGRYIAWRFKIELSIREIVAAGCAMVLLAYVSLINNYGFLDIVQVDICKKASLIKASYNLWDGILLEIENSSEDDVRIERDSDVQWCPYFLFSGMNDEEVYHVEDDVIYSFDQIMPNVYYGKNSIQVDFKENK